MNVAIQILQLVAALGPELAELLAYVEQPARDEAFEQELARRIIRRAFDERAKKEIVSP
jgi:hypothetical protein